MIGKHIKKLTNAVFKLLPMKEEELDGQEVFLYEYIESLKCEALGMMKSFSELKDNYEYIRVYSTLIGVDWYEVDYKTFRREVLKMTSLLNKVQEAVDG